MRYVVLGIALGIGVPATAFVWILKPTWRVEHTSTLVLGGTLSIVGLSFTLALLVGALVLTRLARDIATERTRPIPGGYSERDRIELELAGARRGRAEIQAVDAALRVLERRAPAEDAILLPPPETIDIDAEYGT